MEVQILEFKNDPPEEIEDQIEGFIRHYRVKNTEVVSREDGFLLLIFYEEDE